MKTYRIIVAALVVLAVAGGLSCGKGPAPVEPPSEPATTGEVDQQTLPEETSEKGVVVKLLPPENPGEYCRIDPFERPMDDQKKLKIKNNSGTTVRIIIGLDLVEVEVNQDLLDGDDLDRVLKEHLEHKSYHYTVEGECFPPDKANPIIIIP